VRATTDICVPTSLLRKFLDSQLPHRHDVTKSWSDQLDDCDRQGDPIEERIHNQVGRAFELRVGLDLAPQPGYWDLLSYLPPEMCTMLLTSTGFALPGDDTLPPTIDLVLVAWHRPQQTASATAHTGALLACFAAAAMTDLAHKHPDWRIEKRRWWFDVEHDAGHTSEDLDPTGAATTALTDLWTRYTEHGRAQLRALGDPITLEPSPAPGYAIADIVIGHTLVDIKTHRDPKPLLPVFLDQVLTYTLLDRTDALSIESVGIYLGQQALLLTTPLDSLLRAASTGSTPDMPTLRSALHEVMRPALDDARRRYELKLAGPRRGGNQVRMS
jgi:hypothetical protein